MSKFKKGDRVKVISSIDSYQAYYIGKVGTCLEEDHAPFVQFSSGEKVAFSEYRLVKMKPKSKKKYSAKTYIVSKQYLEAICSVRSTVGDEIEVTVVSE